MTENDKTFGDIVREARERLKDGNPEFSLRRFAQKVGISPTFLSKIETNGFAPPRAEKVIAIANALGLDRDMLLAKANRIDPGIKKIVTEQQPEMAEFLRTSDGMSAEQWRMMHDTAEFLRDQNMSAEQWKATLDLVKVMRGTMEENRAEKPDGDGERHG